MSHALTRSQHPLAMILTHWINLLAMFFLTLSGFYIHFPFVGGLMGVARGTHFFWMFVLLINCLVRLVLLFTVKDSNQADGSGSKADIASFLPQAENRHQLWPFIKYYLFLKKEAPIQGKYNPLQKMAYAIVPLLIIVAAWTGFSIWGPTSGWDIFIKSRVLVSGLFGNADGVAELMSMRILHYWTMWLILIFTAAHAYLANIYNFKPSALVFAWKETPADH